MSSASTWAAPRPTSPISPAATSGPASEWWRACGCARRCCEIHTVAAGGGSICHYDGSRFRVGPDSAGAVPGPACYRRGGPLTVTDCNVVLGKIRAEHFPRVFGPDARPADRCRKPRWRAAPRSPSSAGHDAARRSAEGFIRIAVDNMANAIKQISIARGHDVTRYTLQCFGGAGGQHACLVADALGIETGDDPPARRRAQRLRHGPRRHGRAAAAHAGRRRSRGGARRARGRKPRRRCARRAWTSAESPPPRGAALRRQRHRARSRGRVSTRCGRRSRPRTGAASASLAEAPVVVETAIVGGECVPPRSGEGDRAEAWWRGRHRVAAPPLHRAAHGPPPRSPGRNCMTAPILRPATASPARR